MVLDSQHVKPGKGAAIVKAKLKNLRTGSIAEKTFNAGVKVETAHISKNLCNSFIIWEILITL